MLIRNCSASSFSPVRNFIFCTFFSCFSFVGKGQQSAPYFSSLSSNVYSKRAAEIKERKIPVVYTVKKEQKSYEEIIKERNKSLADDILDDRLLDDTLLVNKCKGIIHRLVPRPSSFPEDSLAVFIYRSLTANASCHGEGTIYVNLGLFLWTDNDDELAFVLAHELSHQLLDHVEGRIRKNIALVSSDEFQEELKDIRKSKDGKYQRYKALIKDLVTQNGSHSRYKESEADSLGLMLAKNAGFDVQKGALILVKLDKVDEIFTAPDIYNVRSLFASVNAEQFLTQKSGRYNGLSMADVTMNADKDFDSVKTHPDCIVRYQKTSGQTNTVPVSCCKLITAPYSMLKEQALHEIIRYEYEIKRYTLSSHLCMFALNNGFKDAFYYDFASLSFSAMFEADKHLEKFGVTDAKAKPGSTLKELQDYIFNANSEKLAGISEAFLNAVPNKSDENYQFAKLKFDTEVKSREKESLQNQFLAANKGSKYAYLIKPKPTDK